MLLDIACLILGKHHFVKYVTVAYFLFNSFVLFSYRFDCGKSYSGVTNMTCLRVQKCCTERF